MGVGVYMQCIDALLRALRGYLDLWLKITEWSTPEVRLVKLGLSNPTTGLRKHEAYPVYTNESVLSARCVCFALWVHRQGVDGTAGSQ